MSNEQTVKELFDGYAVEFDSIYGGKRNAVSRLMDKWFRKSMLIRMQKSIEACETVADKRILDVGTGPGHYAVLLAQKGAREVVGVDFASNMISIARQYAQEKNVTDRCRFETADVMDYQDEEGFDVIIVMGVMDYIPEPIPFIKHLQTLAKNKIVFSFPEEGGVLAWQRRLRYRWFSNCELNMYYREDLENLMQSLDVKDYRIEKIERDFFVTLHV